MSNVTKLSEVCPTCNRKVTLESEFPMDRMRFITYSCGHFATKPLEKSEIEKLQSLTFNNGRNRLFPYQVTAADFARKSGFRCLLNLDTGTGKTIVTIATLSVYLETLTPALIVCKSSLTAHWRKNANRMTEANAQIVESSNDSVDPDLFPITIISFDLLARKVIKKRLNEYGRPEAYYDTSEFDGYKLLVIDETQNIKSEVAKRTHALRKVAATIPHVIGCSATPIKNHAGEYFTILNILRPEMFPSSKYFYRHYVNSIVTESGAIKWQGLRSPDYFYERTKDFIIRMKREDVLPDLPKINRTYQYSDLESTVRKAYEKEERNFCEAYESGEFEKPSGSTELIAYLTRMRRITGLAKVKPVIDQVMEFLETTDRKIVVFVHHHDVATLLEEGLKKAIAESEESDIDYGTTVNMTADFLGKHGQTGVDEFIASNARVALVSTIAGGEGLNFQPVSDCILMERQWNPANEEQAESRFPRPGATAESISASYSIAVGTIDEWITELIEQKRAICSGAIDQTEVSWNESSIIRELADMIAAKGRKRWNFK